MATLTVTIPNSGPVTDVLMDVANRDGFPITGTAAQKQAAFSAWLQFRLQRLYREQAKPVRQQTQVSTLDSQIDTEAATLTVA